MAKQKALTLETIEIFNEVFNDFLEDYGADSVESTCIGVNDLGRLTIHGFDHEHELTTEIDLRCLIGYMEMMNRETADELDQLKASLGQ